MSYSSRVYRQRNPKSQDESKEKPFFPKQNQDQKGKNNNSFFQAKLRSNEPGDSFEKEADSVADAALSQDKGKSIVQQKEKTPIQRKPDAQDREKEKTIQKKDDPLKEKEKVIRKKGEDVKNEEEIQKKNDPLKEKEEGKSKEMVQKK